MSGEDYEETTDLEMSLDMDIKSYAEQDDDMLVGYTYSDTIGEWVYTEQAFDFEEYQEQLEAASQSIADRFEDITLADELDEVGGTEVYVLKISECRMEEDRNYEHFITINFISRFLETG